LKRWAGREIPAVASQELEPGAHGITCEDAERALQYVDAKGVRHQGAAAVVECLAEHGAGRGLRWIYRRVPGVAPVMEWGYGRVARNRGWISHVETALAGPDLEPATYDTAMGLFVRGVAAVFAVAFASLGAQAAGLWGSGGVWPMEGYLAQVARQGVGFWQLPGVFWLGAGDGALRAGWLAGLGVSLLALAGVRPGPMLLAAWGLYLSFCTGGGPFMNFQWDALLLECGVVAALAARWDGGGGGLALRHPAVARWLAWAVLFKLMWFSGVVKLSSGDPAWAGLTALGDHFETQPLPNPAALAAHRLPELVQAGLTAGMFAIELVLPWAIWLPRRARWAAAAGFAVLQVGILATGNYGFFNLLALFLTVTLVDDAAWRRIGVPGAGAAAGRMPWRRAVPALAWGVVVVLSAWVQVPGVFRVRVEPPQGVAAALEAVRPFRSANSYGLFAVMTTDRVEITLQGSADGMVWRDYVFPYKPGPPERRPPVCVGHMPRLDWQMWFAALGEARGNPWLVMLARRLLEGSPAVLGLLEENPFPDGPPKYVRAVAQGYRFARADEPSWWVRSDRGLYLLPLALENFRE
jgi:hypothetical protein